MSQSTTTTTTLVSEGALPIHLLGGESLPPSSRDARISSVPVTQSPAIPAPRLDDENPPTWPSHIRGVPNYRPLDLEVDYVDRPMGQNNVEYTFLLFMFTGVRITGLANKAWRGSVGKITDEVFKYKIGGQW